MLIAGTPSLCGRLKRGCDGIPFVRPGQSRIAQDPCPPGADSAPSPSITRMGIAGKNRLDPTTPPILPNSCATVRVSSNATGIFKPRVESLRIQGVPERINGLLAADLLQNQQAVRPVLGNAQPRIASVRSRDAVRRRPA